MTRLQRAFGNEPATLHVVELGHGFAIYARTAWERERGGNGLSDGTVYYGLHHAMRFMPNALAYWYGTA